MHDLKKLERKFHEFLKPNPEARLPDLSEIKITEKLLEQSEMVYIPFGWVTYFLVIEDERPVIYAHAVSRMDLNSICFIDEDGHECYDIFYGDHKDIQEKYRSRSRNVGRLKGLNGIPE